ncbi:MAG: N-acetylmuramoyl-L-alanine amidase [Lachnospiraceae bacterium]|nr:N-acetylmuramoyl-L-alanine amidase [Lachnospiraceae bacterium]
MKINVHAGHNPDGKVACGAVGLIYESTEARNVVSKLITILQKAGHTVYNCTVDNGTSQSDVLNKIVKKCNSNSVDLDISIHFNAGAKDTSGNGVTTGTEVLVYDKATKAYGYAEKVCTEISKLGYKNRGVKVNQGLYFLNNTKAPAMLIECCFVDDADDVKLYSADKIARAIATAIVGDIKEDEEMEKTAIKVSVNGAEKTLEGFNVEGTNYVTIRALCELLGVAVDYDSATKTVMLSK